MENKPVLKQQNSTLFMLMSIIFCTCLLIANVCAYKLISIGPFAITSGVLVFPITYIINDLIAEVYGFNKAKKVIWFGFAMNLFMVLYFQLAIALPYPVFFTGQENFAAVLGGGVRILTASFLAYLVGSLVNAGIMSKMKVATKGKGLMLRAVVSTLFGEALDSSIFVMIAFAFIYDWKSIFVMIATQTILKTVYEIIAFPVTKTVIKKVKAYEGLDTFDEGLKYKPF